MKYKFTDHAFRIRFLDFSKLVVNWNNVFTKFFWYCFVSLAKFSYWSKFYVIIIYWFWSYENFFLYKMEYYKISRLLNNSTVSTFVGKITHSPYSVNKNIRFKTPMLRWYFYHYSDSVNYLERLTLGQEFQQF